MPPCHCGRPSVVGVGFNRAPLYLCLKHLKAFKIAKYRTARPGPNDFLHDAELRVAHRVLVALGRGSELES